MLHTVRRISHLQKICLPWLSGFICHRGKSKVTVLGASPSRIPWYVRGLGELAIFEMLTKLHLYSHCQGSSRTTGVVYTIERTESECPAI